jgi:myo-inositol 2-dehydrogenase/D-chiro-inositol 1-dehydrogenase
MIGCGMIGQIHAASLAHLVDDGDVRAVAAADPSEHARSAAARNCAFEHLHDDGRAVVDDPEVEAVMITSPTASHRELVLATLAVGKPLLCEKPLAPEFGIVRELRDAVAASGVTAQVGFHTRFNYIANSLRDLVATRELGGPMGYVLRDDQYWPTGQVVPGHSSWRSDRSVAGGGALLEHTIHGIDVACWLFGPAVRVWARTRSVFGYDVEDVAAVTVEHADGTIGSIVTIFSGVRGREETRVEVFFEGATVETTIGFVVGAEEDGYLLQRADSSPERPDLAAMRDEHFARLGITRRDFFFPTYPSDRAWVLSVRAQEPASPGFDDALRAHALVEAAYRAAASGEPVELVGELAVAS